MATPRTMGQNPDPRDGVIPRRHDVGVRGVALGLGRVDGLALRVVGNRRILGQLLALGDGCRGLRELRA